MTALNGVNGAPPRGKVVQKYGGMFKALENESG